jgi:hypothetical protein
MRRETIHAAAGRTAKKRKKDLFSASSIKKVDKKLLTAALARSRQPTGKIREDVKRKTKKDVDTVSKSRKNAKFIGNILKKDAQERAYYKKKPSLKKMKESIRK